MQTTTQKPLHERSTFVVGLTWETCPSGFEIVDIPDPFPPDAMPVERFREQGLYFQAKNADTRAYTTRADSPDDLISMRFANVRDDAGMTGFLNRYGLPIALGRMAVADLFNKRDQIAQFLTEYLKNTSSLSSERIDEFLDQFWLTPRVVANSQNGVRLELRPRSLWQYMFLELILASSVGATAASCECCGDAFLVGPLTGRRSHSRFCSDRCRVKNFRSHQR